MKGVALVSVMLLVKAEFNAAVITMLISVRFASVGLGTKESILLCREVATVKLSAPVLSSR